MGEGVLRPGSVDDFYGFGVHLTRLRLIDLERFELWNLPDSTNAEHQSTVAQGVYKSGVFGDPQRVMERKYGSGDAVLDALGPLTRASEDSQGVRASQSDAREVRRSQNQVLPRSRSLPVPLKRSASGRVLKNR